MTLQQLQYFITVCKYQSLTKAARELSISQPGISTEIRDLETECGFPLFEHRPNSIALTDQGRAGFSTAAKATVMSRWSTAACCSVSTGTIRWQGGESNRWPNWKYPAHHAV